MRGFDHATIFSSSFRGLCKERLAQWPAFSDPISTKNSGGGGALPEKLGGGVLHASRLTLTLFPGKTCDFPYPISDLIKKFDTLFQTWSPGSPARDRSAWQDVTTRTQLACVASVSERFRSKERGTRVKDRAKNGASKRAGRGRGRKEGNACRQTPRFLKPPTWSVIPEFTHWHLMLSSAVIIGQ